MSISQDNSTLPKERIFGLFFTCVFIVFAAIKCHYDKPFWAILWAVLSVITFAVTLHKPIWLHPFNKAWYGLGILLGKIVSPLVLGIIFFLIISPIAIGMRLCRRDALHLYKKPQSSYWLDRNPAGPSGDSFINQF